MSRRLYAEDEPRLLFRRPDTLHFSAVLFADETLAAKIMASDHPRDQKALGRKVSNFNEETWKENCRDIVKRGNLAKFSQNDDLRAELMKTRGTTLVEAAPGDTVWGIGLSATNWKAQHRQRWRGKKSVG
ncbi:N-glycosidase R617 [Geodia barretti]|uniref:N-glycosidase R617 n=1 Tax=Geodia barretti TaxID=519541 RepID=A0AA35X6E0_GEOBA|nr:N-glycosidase R617 [Geodia barretti]